MVMKKNRLKPYQNWDKKEFESILIKHINGLKIDIEFQTLWVSLVKEAFTSKDWDVLEDYNGCTVVQDYLQPSMACFCHDYMWITGHGGLMADRIFKQLMYAQGVPIGKAKRRWLGVRIAWIFGYYWKYRKRLKEPTKAMININKKLRLVALRMDKSTKK